MHRIAAFDVTPDFFKQYHGLPKEIKVKFKKQLSVLRQNPRHQSLKMHKLKGSDFIEIYVDDCYRCVTRQEGNVYRLYFVGTHRLIDRFK